MSVDLSFFGPSHNLLSIKDAIVYPEQSVSVGDDGEIIDKISKKGEGCNCHACKTKVIVQNGSGASDPETKKQLKMLESEIEQLKTLFSSNKKSEIDNSAKIQNLQERVDQLAVGKPVDAGDTTALQNPGLPKATDRESEDES